MTRGDADRGLALILDVLAAAETPAGRRAVDALLDCVRERTEDQDGRAYRSSMHAEAARLVREARAGTGRRARRGAGR